MGPQLDSFLGADDLGAIGADPMVAPQPQVNAPSVNPLDSIVRGIASRVPSASAAPLNTDLQGELDKTRAAMQPGESQSQSGSVANQAVNFNTLDKLETGKGATRLDKKNLSDERRRLGQAGAENQNLAPGYSAEEQAATQGAQAQVNLAADKAGNPDVAKGAINDAAQQAGLAGVTTTGAAQMAAAQASVLAKEQTEAAKAVMKADAARAQYTESLARIKSVEPNRLVSNQPLAYGLQNMVSTMMMISGKPGMMAAGNSLQSNMFESMQRDVDAQLANIQKDEKVSDGFKQAYDMVVSDNDTQAQARDKMYGAYLSSMEGYVEAQLGTHDTEGINAQLQQTLAGIKLERATVENKNYDNALKLASDDAQRNTQVHMNAVNASVEQSKIAEAKATRLAAGKAAEKARTDQLANEGVYLTTPSGGNVYAGQIKGVNDSEKAKNHEKVLETMSTSSTVTGLLTKIEDLNNKIANKDAAGLAAMGFENTASARDALMQQVNTLNTVAGTTMARALGMAPISDFDVTSMEQAVGTETFKNHVAGWITGEGGGSAKSTAEVISYVTKNANNELKSYVRPGTAEEINANAGVYGADSMYDIDGKGNKVPAYGARLAAGTETYGQYAPDAFPAEGKRANAELNPPAPTAVDEIRKQGDEYKPGGEKFDRQDAAEAPPYFLNFAEDMKKSGRGFHRGNNDDQQDYLAADSAVLGEYSLEGAAKNPDRKVGAVYVPNYADDVAKAALLLNEAKESGDADTEASATDLLTTWAKAADDRSDLASWALKNPDQFTRKNLNLYSQ